MSQIGITYDLRGSFGKARDQASRPTCLAFAASDAHAAVRGPWEELSAEYLYYQCKQRDGLPPSDGTTLDAVRDALYVDGQPLESDWPYLDTHPSDPAKWAPPVGKLTMFCRDSEETSPTFNDAWGLIQHDCPALIGMSISDAFYTPDSDGLVKSKEAIDPVRRHAVIGVAIGLVGGDRILLVRNSWGVDWGVSGYAWLTEAYLSKRLLWLASLEGSV